MPNTLLNFEKKSTMDNRFTEIIKTNRAIEVEGDQSC
jgi:hypothetical protein